MNKNGRTTRALFVCVVPILLVTSLILVAPHPPEPQNHEGELTWLRVDGNHIEDEYGRIVFLRGAAFGDLSWRTMWAGNVSHRVDQLVNLTGNKANVIRCAITPQPDDTRPDDPYYPWSATLVDPENNRWETEIHPEVYDEEVDELIAVASNNDVYVIIEFHGGFNETYSEALALDPTPWISWHLHFVNRYVDNPVVAGFELYNEPWQRGFGGGDMDLGRERWISMATQAVEAIDEANPKALIIVASTPFSEVMQYWVDNPLPHNVVYGWDSYYKNWDPYWKEEYANGNWEGGHNKTYRMLHEYHIGKAVAAGLPIIATEFAWYGNPDYEPGWEHQMADYLSIINEWETNWYEWWWWTSPNGGLARNNYEELSPTGEIWAEFLWDGAQPSIET